MGNSAWIEKGLALNKSVEWTKWRGSDGQVAGYFEQYSTAGKPLTFLTVKGAGHMVPRDRRVTLLYGFAILAAGAVVIGMTGQPDDRRLLLLLLGVVIATDIAGYFAGRLFGGPKFWPRISPKKTWSGTIAGWVGAAAIGWIFMAKTGSGVELIGISVALSMASQMGDIAESAVKRRMGVKDSSNLLPGHGGVYDRFDGLLGAAFLLVIVESLTAFPPPPL